MKKEIFVDEFGKKIRIYRANPFHAYLCRVAKASVTTNKKHLIPRKQKYKIKDFSK